MLDPSSLGERELSRRHWLALGTGLAISTASAEHSALAAQSLPSSSGSKLIAAPGVDRFRYCLNTSTIRGQNLSVPEQIDVAADAGYTGIELWVGDLEKHAKSGRSLEEVGRKLRDRGLTVPSSIAFFNWISDDPIQRKKGVEQAKREMELARRVGTLRIAAPPAGVRESSRINLLEVADRYRQLIEIGVSIGVVPQLELWGFSKAFSRLGEAVLVAMESGHPQACLLLDVYHIYKGGSDFESLRFVSGQVLHVLHMNDYPAQPPRAKIDDAARVFPGDGVAPLPKILRTLHKNGFDGFLSLEVFNRDYWRQDAHLVARTGLQKMRKAVKLALAGSTRDS